MESFDISSFVDRNIFSTLRSRTLLVLVLRRDEGFFSLPPRPDLQRDTHTLSILPDGYRGLFPWWKKRSEPKAHQSVRSKLALRFACTLPYVFKAECLNTET
jgi:hypothetical protein